MKKKLKQLLSVPIQPWEKFILTTNNDALHPFVMNSARKSTTKKKVYYKGYGRMREILLPKPHLSKKVSLVRSLNKRTSSRSFHHSVFRTAQLSTLLYYGFGLNS